jgi:hypothetical protein
MIKLLAFFCLFILTGCVSIGEGMTPCSFDVNLHNTCGYSIAVDVLPKNKYEYGASSLNIEQGKISMVLSLAGFCNGRSLRENKLLELYLGVGLDYFEIDVSANGNQHKFNKMQFLDELQRAEYVNDDNGSSVMTINTPALCPDFARNQK